MFRLMLCGVVGLLSAGAARAGANDFFSELAKDFGTSAKGTILTHYFTVTNKSGQPVTIGQPRVSCGCVSATVLNSQLSPGQSTAVVAYMDTNRIPVPGVTKTVIVYVPFNSNGHHEEVQLRVTTVTRADLILSPSTIDLGTVRAGQEGKGSTKITFFSDPNWKVSNPSSTGVYLKPEVKPASGPGSSTGTYELTVTLDPKCPAGNWTADINLTTTGAGVEKLRIPVTVNVVPAITVNPQTVAFGDVPVGKAVEKQVMVQSQSPFAVTEIKKGASGLDVSQLATGPRPTHIFKLSFNPLATGPAQGAFEILTDSKDMPKVSVPWTANVVK